MIISGVAVLTLCFLPLFTHSFTPKNVTIQGDLMLGALVPLTEQACLGDLHVAEGVFRMEAIAFAVQEANRNILNDVGFTIGLFGLDTCSDANVALRQSLLFVDKADFGLCIDPMGKSHQDEPRRKSHYAQSYSRAIEGSEEVEKWTKCIEYPDVRFYGIVGPSNSEVTKVVDTLLGLFCLPLISYAATSTDFDAKPAYPYFLRTVPSDTYQAEAIVDILVHFNWTFASVVFEDTAYGTSLWESIRSTILAKSRIDPAYENICFEAGAIPIDPRETQANLDILAESLFAGQARVILLLATDTVAANFFKSVNSIMPKYRDVEIQWVGSDGWSRTPAVEAFDSTFQGAVTIHPLVKSAPNLNAHLRSLGFNNSGYNPWIAPLIQQQYDCCLHMGAGCKQPCIGNETLKVNDSQTETAHFAMEAVFLYAKALRTLVQEYCPGDGESWQEPCDEFHRKIRGEEIISTLEKTVLNDNDGFSFEFYERSGPPAYSIFQYNCSRSSNDVCSWKNIGHYNASAFVFTANPFLPSRAQVENATNNCYPQCKANQRRKYAMVSSVPACCWTCADCQQFSVVTGRRQEDCQDCPMGKEPDADYRNCTESTPIYVDFRYSIVYVCLVGAGIGLVFTIFVAIIFFKRWDTPIVRASSRELSCILLFSIGLIFTLPYLYLTFPTPFSCGLYWFLTSLLFTVCAATILVKTITISRVFRLIPFSTFNDYKLRYSDRKSQIALLVLLTSIQVLLSTVLFVAAPPDASISRQKFHGIENTVITCSFATKTESALPLIYPLILILVTLVFAYMVRKAPDGFNEARFITVCAIIICTSNLALIPAFYVTQYFMAQHVILDFDVMVTGYAFLCCIFVPKVVALLARGKNKNTRESVMSRKRTSNNLVAQDVPSETAVESSPIAESPSPTFTTTKLELSEGSSNGSVEVKEDRVVAFSV